VPSGRAVTTTAGKWQVAEGDASAAVYVRERAAARAMMAQVCFANHKEDKGPANQPRAPANQPRARSTAHASINKSNSIGCLAPNTYKRKILRTAFATDHAPI
jgi:hypothetical protein